MPTLQAYLGGFLTEEATLLTLKTSKLTVAEAAATLYIKQG